MRAKHIISCAIALLLVIGLSSIALLSTNKAKADTINSTIYDYSNKILFVPTQAIPYLNITTNGGYVQALNYRISIYQRYTFQPNTSPTAYIYTKDAENLYLNGLSYVGGGTIDYIIYQNGNYTNTSWTYSNEEPIYYIILEFEDYSNYPQEYANKINCTPLSTLYTYGVRELEAGPHSANDYLFYMFLGDYWASKEDEYNYDIILNDILSRPNDFGLYNQQQYDANYTRGQQDSNSAFSEYTNVLRTAWNGATTFLDTNVLGGIKIIHFIAIPLLLGLLLIILKLIRG